MLSNPPSAVSHLLTPARAFSTPRGRKCPGVNNWSSFIDTFLHFGPFCRARKVSIYCEACLRVHIALFTYMGTSSPFVLAAASVSCASCRHPALPLSLRRTCLVVPTLSRPVRFSRLCLSVLALDLPSIPPRRRILLCLLRLNTPPYVSWSGCP